jgi:protein-L-isoaspartate(D-aspartate) O-methyltransferase
MRNLNIDNFTFNQMRNQREELIASLHRKGIKDEKVLTAMLYLPREIFVLPSLSNRAYENSALPIKDKQTISQPYTVAYMTEFLNVHEGDKILEIGTGSGYQAVLLYLLGASVFSVERIRNLYEYCRSLFSELGAAVNSKFGDGSLGWSSNAPYDSIIVTAAAPEIPNKLILQLKVGGKMIIPIGDKNVQDMYVIVREDEEHYSSEQLDKFKFVPLIGKNGWENQP